MQSAFTIAEITGNKEQAVRTVLEALPEWFGLPDENAKYVRTASAFTMIGVYDGDALAGWMALRPHQTRALELYLMAVRPEYHGRGAGTMLVDEAARRGMAGGFKSLVVWSLHPTHPDGAYKRTRQFYEKCGFRYLCAAHDVSNYLSLFVRDL